jgi:1-acyl-sn-glycerol-3-phosphate acyltransferase
MKRIVLWFTNHLMRFLFDILCRMDVGQLDRIPQQGPLLLIANHVNFLEMPALYPRLHSRNYVALVKDSTWYSFVLGLVFDMHRAIPVRRWEADLNAMRLCQEALDSGKILAIAPEGTRSGDGCLQEGTPGMALLAIRNGAPVLPFVYFGGEDFWQNLKRFRRTDFHVVVGNPFRVVIPGGRPSKEIVVQVRDEMMYQLAALLPARYRGIYSDYSKATEHYLQFDSGVKSNLLSW